MTLKSSFLFLLLFAACSLGCGGGPKFAPVSGRVTLNEKPLPDAYVVFQPAVGEPSEVSQGKTDADGMFSLDGTQGQDGAKVGKHTVSITTIAPDAMDDERSPLPRGKVPQKYRDRPFESTVVEGENEANFDLTTRK